MNKQSCQPTRQQMKRKRRASDDCSDGDIENLENLPVHDEKKHREETHVCGEDEPCCSYEPEGERQPLSELKIVACQSLVGAGQDNSNSIDGLVSETERFSVTESFVGLDSSNCDVAELSDLEGLSPDYSEPYADDSRQCSRLVSSNSRLHHSSSEDDIDDTTTDVLGQLTPLTDRILDRDEIRVLLPLHRYNPLPPLDWADLPDLWGMLCLKDADSLRHRDPDLFLQHPCIEPRMRAVLLDWLAEVCDVYRLHRETYYLALDYIDRYLSKESNIPKQRLQLIGITCLQIAAKNEEIYPPKINEYAYVTDGACSDSEILKMEITIIQNLDWELNPITPLYWLKVFMQLCYQDKARHQMGFLYPQFSITLYDRVTRLLNLVTLDAGSLNYSYSTLATSCVYLAVSSDLALGVSGLTKEDIDHCVKWMSCFWNVLKEEVSEYQKPLGKSLPPGVTKAAMLDDTFNLQTHNVNLNTLEASQARLEESLKVDSCLLTPPPSSKKAKKIQAFT